MSKRRTKSQKQAAHGHYRLGTWYETSANEVSVTTPSTAVTAFTLYGYAPALIRNDLWKTVWVTLGILLLEIGLYRFWH